MKNEERSSNLLHKYTNRFVSFFVNTIQHLLEEMLHSTLGTTFLWFEIKSKVKSIIIKILFQQVNGPIYEMLSGWIPKL